MPKSDISIHIGLITFDDYEREAVVRFEVVEGEELDEIISLSQRVPCPDREDFDTIIQDAAKALYGRLQEATYSLARQYGL